jgi:hypothetical protein
MTDVRAQADELVAGGRWLDAIEVLRLANREAPDPAIERRLAHVRNAAFDHLEPHSTFDEWPAPVVATDPDGTPCLPEITRAELDAETVRRAILAHGGVCVRGLLDPDQVDEIVPGIDTALAVRDKRPKGDAAPLDQSWFAALPLPADAARLLGRNWVAGSGGVLAADSPRLLFRLFETYEDVGLRQVVADYLGERPVLSANKCTLRRVPLTASTDWHQDGAFLGRRGIRVLNVWVALTDCGIDAPGLDVLPRRLDHIVETGTGGAIFDWAVGPAVVEQLAVDATVLRPEFRAGDAVLFDEMYLHRTAIEPTMTRPRYAIESWFFAPTSYPAGQVPLVW